ncbi:SRPBCC family protein [Tolumonas lignilytica]|jgi:Oligoketide cyclase/lipid transport protein|uniref:SRPBCC family protein n=1 Tax=Tolumonas lignilytica TaxID=1283284 RepID=UPI0004671BC2|nr:SRPBCC family protein [Tolumonas lignilytica]
MARVNRSALVMFSAEQMFRLVNDVEAYPFFLPGCVNGQILEKSTDQMVAVVSVSKAGIQKTFTTKNTLMPFNAINMELVEGPFKMLRGIWRFISLDEQACKIELDLEFEFKSVMIELAFGKIFKELTGAMVQAFTQRAKEVYGV